MALKLVDPHFLRDLRSGFSCVYFARWFSATAPLNEFSITKPQYIELTPKKRKIIRFWGRDSYGNSSGRYYEAPNCDEGLTNDQIVAKALSFYRVNQFRTQPIDNLKLPAPSLSPAPRASPTQDTINPEFYNRNPRNMELLNLDLKNEGWDLEAKRRDYYNRLIFERTSGHTKAFVEHISGRIIVSASTEEFAISKHLYRSTDTSAAHNIGRVLARRMLETGIVFVYCPYTQEEREAQKVAVFLKALTDSGIQLQEGERIKAPELFTGKDDYTLGPMKNDILERTPQEGLMGHSLDDFTTVYK